MAVAFPSPQQRRKLSWIFDIPIDLGCPDELLDRVVGWSAARRPGDPPKQVMYANAHVLNQSAQDVTLRRILESADLVYCDGYGVRLAAKALDVPIPHRMTGADWIWGLADLCERGGRSIFLLGSEPGVAHAAAARLQAVCPRLEVAGHHHGFFELGSPHEERVIEHINACNPSIVLAGMGTPKQERWVQRSAPRLEADVLWTVGALFDVVSGRLPRAPAWLADNGLEWIFRLAIEPGRMWRRYLLGNPVFVHRVASQARARHAARS